MKEPEDFHRLKTSNAIIVVLAYGSLYISWSKTDYTRIEKTAYSFYVRRLADGGQEKGSR